ncbi:MAG TPA: VWA domain-containing protein [Candidatus Binataceae bacterium]|nr:VWA domain-containing protein [Candidatus Binataceae bacterium]
MKQSRFSRALAAQRFAAMVCLVVLLATAGSGIAQQGSFVPPPQLPRSQGQGGGSVLEVPAIPGRQGGESASIPRIAPQQSQSLTVPSRELRSQAGYEQATVTVTDQQGRYVTGLQKGDFKLFIDGQQRPIEFFRQDLNTPVSLGILVDTSGSMEPKLSQAEAAITEFINDLNERDDVFLFAFSSEPFLLQPFTMNHRLLISRLPLLYAQGETAIFDTIIDGLMMVRGGHWDKKALLVVTDGQDNASEFSLADVIGRARQMGVLIYSIGIGNPNSPMGGVGFGLGPFSFIAGGEDHVDTRMLGELSSETGARTFVLRTIGDGAAMREDCEMISRELREQYTVGFVAPDPGRGGYRNLRVDVPNRPDDSVRVRKGVMVGGPGTESASAYPEH